ncbi:SatD family protein [Ulvibacter antarcticus]|uniref:SatD family protein n=1 Tax=Ulvibacter antarcticus TaxID=442714 RepID=A0A3L9ZCR6_9FLAO|nr:SatD family protein [Ulvibacter antarcticus]RMA64442.1 hypothetical protein BXY75_1318 [Ulvibacter antarcticus]
MKTIAILSGDLINSSEYNPDALKAVVQVLKNEFSKLEKQFPNESIFFSMYRGDSFQGVVENTELALSMALQIKAAVRAYVMSKDLPKNAIPMADIRISIGIGKATYKKGALEESNGEAFQFSGRTLDAMKSEGVKMALTTANQEINAEFKVHLKFLDSITDRWSVASAEVVYFLLKRLKEQDIATRLNRSQAAINQRKKAAGWDEIKLLLERYIAVAQNNFK